MSGGREERRWVVKDLGDGSYVMSINGCGWGTQSEAERMTLAQARKTRKLLAGTLDHVVVCRLISRAEAVARAVKWTRVETLGEVHAALLVTARGFLLRPDEVVSADFIARTLERLAKETGR
jgi:hypothetical protein